MFRTRNSISTTEKSRAQSLIMENHHNEVAASGIEQLRRKKTKSSIMNLDYLVSKPLGEWMESIGVSHAKGAMLDYGCGNRPYYDLFLPRLTRYLGADVAQNASGNVDILIDVNGIVPLGDASMDTVLSTQVLEHVSEPQQYLREASRILRPGGTLILTCPAAYMLHEEPHDFYRYTIWGIRYLLDKFDFDIVSIDTTGGVWRLLGQTFLNHKAYGRKFRIPIISGITYYFWLICTNLVIPLLDRLNLNTKDTLNYQVIAVKRGGK